MRHTITKLTNIPRPGKPEVKQGKFVEFISPAKGYFREIYKSQNINPISPISEIVSEYDQEIPQSQTVDKPVASCV